MMRRHVHKEVEDALLEEQVDVPIELPPPRTCRAMHLKRLPGKFDDREEARRCAMCDL